MTQQPEKLQSLRDEWTYLQDTSVASCIYLTWQWITLWWQHFGHTGDLWLLEARETDDNRLIGLAPLICVRHQPKYGLPWRQIQFIGVSFTCEHLDFIVEEGREEEVITAFVETLMAHRSRWDVLRLSNLIEGTPTLAILDRMECSWRTEEPLIAPFIPLPDDWNTYYSTLGRRMRKGQRRRVRRFNEAYPDNAFHCATDSEELDATLDALIRLHQAKWEAAGEEGAFGTPRTQKFWREASRMFLTQDWLRLCCLKADGRIVAANLAYQYRGRVYDYTGGTAEDMMEYDLGHLLNERLIARAIEEGQQEYDFLWGDEPYKYIWRAKDRHNYSRIFVANRRVKMQLILLDTLRRIKSRLVTRKRNQTELSPS